MSSLFGTGSTALTGATPSSAAGLPTVPSGEGSVTSHVPSSTVGDNLPGRNSSIGAAATLTRPNSTDGRTSLFGAGTSSAGQAAASSAHGVGEVGNKPGGAALVGGSLLGSSIGSAVGSGGASSTFSLFSGQNALTSNLSTPGGGLFGSAGLKPFSLLGAGSDTTSTANTTGGGSSAAPSHASAGRSEPLINTSSSTSASGPSTSIFGTGKSAETGQPVSTGIFFSSGGADHGRPTGTSQNSTASQAGSSVASVTDKGQSSVPAPATDSKTSFLATPSGGLFGSTSTALPASSSSGLSGANKTSDSAAPSAASTAARPPDAGGASAGNETAVGGGASKTTATSGTDFAGNSGGGLFGKSGLSSASSAAPQTYERESGQNVRLTNVAPSTLHSASPDIPVPCTAAGSLLRPREVALDTLQHELLEEVLAKWERRLDRRVEQFIAVAEEVDSVEKAMIEESRKIQQLMNEQARLERKQVYTAGVIDSLEHQQQGLMTLLRSIENAVFELRSGGPAEIPFAAKDTTYSPTTAAARTRDAGVWYRLLRGAAGEGGSAGPTSASAEPGSSSRPSGKSFADRSALAPSMPLLSSAEQLALERLRNFDEQLAEVGQSLSYAAETFQAGPLGAIAQVLAVHQAALRAAANQAAHIEERMHQLQEAWEVSKGRPGSEGGFLKQSG